MTRCRRGHLATWALGVGILAGGAAGCTRALAETVPDGPPLATPAPPPRVLAPVEAVLAEAPPPPEVPVESVPEPSAETRPPTRRPAVADQKPPDPPPAPAPAVVADGPAVRQPAANPAEEKKILEILQRASRDLQRVNYQNLKGDGQSQYDQSKRFSELAELAIKDRNYPLALTHADKAATMAAQLLPR